MFKIKIEFTKHGELPETLVELMGDIPHHDHDLRESIKHLVYPVLMDRFLHPQLPDEELNDETWIEVKFEDKMAIVLNLKFRNLRLAIWNEGRLNERWLGWETKDINEVINAVEEQIARYEAQA